MFNRKERSGRSRLTYGVPLAAGLLAVATLPSWATPIPVTHVACDSNPVTAGTNLINAIAAANNPVSGPQILSLAESCHYVLTAALDGTTSPSTSEDLKYGNTGTPVILNSVGILGNGSTISRSTAAGTPNFRVLTVGPGGQLSIDSVTIKNGNATCDAPSTLCSAPVPVDVEAFGGGIGVVSGILDVVHAKLIGNSATCDTGGCTGTAAGAAGGAIEAQLKTTAPGPNTAYVMITDSTLDDNNATCTDTGTSTCAFAGGGAVDVTGADLHVLRSGMHRNSVTCTNTSGTTCTSAFGGALDAGGSPDEVSVAATEFEQNSATSDVLASGGAVALTDAPATLSDNVIRQNTATATGSGTSDGGGVAAEAVALPNVNTSIVGGNVDHNSATADATSGLASGGGIAGGVQDNLSFADLSVSENTVTAEVTQGGGVASEFALHAARARIDNNSATGVENFGGGLAAVGSVVLEQGSVSENRINGSGESLGGGISLFLLEPSAVPAGPSSLVDMDVDGNSIKDSSTAFGGGIITATTGLVTIQGGRVHDNRVASPPGVALGGGVVTIAGALGVVGGAQITDNSANGATAAGGGIYNGVAQDEVDPSSRVADNHPDQCANSPVVGC
jgi:hypothetical protein